MLSGQYEYCCSTFTTGCTIKFNCTRFVPDLDDIVCFEDLMKEEEQEASAVPDETVAAARFVSVVCECVSRVSKLLGSQRNHRV